MDGPYRGGKEGRVSPVWEDTCDLQGRSVPAISWTVAAPERDLPRLKRWRRAVGPARFGVPRSRSGAGLLAATPVTIVAWNVHVGGGSVAALWRYLRDHGLDAGPLVLLLQEAFSAEDVPGSRRGAAQARRIHASPPGEARSPVVSFAREFGLSLLYVPSMRNGGPGGHPSEDRGNAILANIPLNSPGAIELPFERQRRVAVTAQIAAGSDAWTLCSLHLENRAPWRRAWRTLGTGRRRQMAALLNALPSEQPGWPLVVGGDFNTWVGGRREPAYTLARAVLPEPADPDCRPTHRFEIGGWLRLSDHLLFRLPPGWRGGYRRLDQTFGSDHYPLLGVVEPDG